MRLPILNSDEFVRKTNVADYAFWLRGKRSSNRATMPRR